MVQGSHTKTTECIKTDVGWRVVNKVHEYVKHCIADLQQIILISNIVFAMAQITQDFGLKTIITQLQTSYGTHLSRTSW